MVEKYLKMDLNLLRTELMNDVMINPFEGEKIVQRLKGKEAYRNDYAFRLVIDSVDIVLLSVMGRYKEMIPACTDLIERASSYEMWRELSIGWNAMGNAYYGMGIFESAIGCYLRCIGNEKRHNLNEMASIGYNNIALIYMNFEEHDRASKYLSLAFQALEEGGEKQPRYRAKKILYIANLVMELCKLGEIEKVEEILGTIREEECRGNLDSLYAYYVAFMYYYFYISEFEKGREAYYSAKACILGKESPKKMTLMRGYALLCEKFNRDDAFYVAELQEAEAITNLEIMTYSVEVYEILRNYYKSIGDIAKYELLTEIYIDVLKSDLRETREQQLISVEVAESLYAQKEAIEDVTIENKELKLIAEEAIKNKNALQEAYQRVEIINEVGRKITASLDLNEVVEIMYRNMKQNIPIDIFVVMVPDNEKEKLKSLVFYSYDKLHEETEIELSDPKSIFAECFKEQKTILSWDERQEARFAGQRAEADRPSAIFLPLYLDGKTIGVCSVQYHGANSYTEKHLKFLGEISPYLAIAINNALRSWELEKEVKSHLETQRKLQVLNAKLEKMSSLDGLTEINGRRSFEEKIIELLKEAQEEKKSLCILMIDIDNFKAYNDTYGHLEGDEVLKTVAGIFRKNMDEVAGLSARFGGEEFIGAGIGLSKEESFGIADRIRQEIQDVQIEHKTTKLGVLTVSVGVAIAYDVEANRKSELMRIADKSLYRAKNSGKNKVILTEI